MDEITCKQCGELHGGMYDKIHEQSRRVYDSDGLCPTVHTMGGGGQELKIEVKSGTSCGYETAEDGDSINLAYPESDTRRGRVGDKVSQTLTTSDAIGVAIEDTNKPRLRVRKLTERECFRLMGVKDKDYENAHKRQSTSSMYHLAGDSIVTSCLMAIFGQMIEGVDWKERLNDIFDFKE